MKHLTYVLVILLTAACGSKGSPTSPSTSSPTPSTPAPPPVPTTGTFSGFVRETAPTEDRIIAGATLEILNGGGTGRTTTSDGGGAFSFPDLSLGDFALRVGKPGYAQRDFTVTFNATNTSGIARLAPAPQTITRTVNDAVNAGSPICPDAFTTTRLPCKQYEIPAHYTGRLTAVLTWTGSRFGSAINDLDLALLKAPRTNTSDRLVISRTATELREEISVDVTAGTLYYVHVLYYEGSTAQNFRLELSHPN